MGARRRDVPILTALVTNENENDAIKYIKCGFHIIQVQMMPISYNLSVDYSTIKI